MPRGAGAGSEHSVPPSMHRQEMLCPPRLRPANVWQSCDKGAFAPGAVMRDGAIPPRSNGSAGTATPQSLVPDPGSCSVPGPTRPLQVLLKVLLSISSVPHRHPDRSQPARQRESRQGETESRPGIHGHNAPPFHAVVHKQTLVRHGQRSGGNAGTPRP